MGRYRWEIRTGTTWYAGTDANVYLSLVGDKNSMKEMELNDPDDDNDWEKGNVNHDVFTTADLGNITTGTLRQDGTQTQPDWTVDYCKITNDEDGRVWNAGVNAELKGNEPFRLVFALTERGQYDEIQKRNKDEATRKKIDDADAAAKADEEAADRDAADEERKFRKDLERQKRQLTLELAKAKQQAELEKLRAQIAQSQGGGQTSQPLPAGPQGGMLRTFELFGIVGGRLAPLTSAVSVDRASGRASVVPGASVMVTDQAGEGFGLAGIPGRWQQLYMGRSPSEFGLDSDKAVLASDGSRGWALDAKFLSQIFGMNWRQAVYS